MKTIIIGLFIILGTIYTQADEAAIDRTGWHFGIGVMGIGNIIECGDSSGDCYFEDGSAFILPMLDMVLEYGVTPQFALSLEHQGYIIAALISFQGKYYLHNAKESTFFVGGVESIYAFGYGIDNIQAAKVGIGYAWNHNEIEFDIHKNTETLFSFGWRYKF
jgi:hypothetical protein